MKKAAILSIYILAIAGCEKTGRAWVMNNSPYWDMFFESAVYIVAALVVAGLLRLWLGNHWKYRGTKTPILTAAVVFLVLSGYGVYRGYDYIHTACTWEYDRAQNCPNYKTDKNWPTHVREAE